MPYPIARSLSLNVGTISHIRSIGISEKSSFATKMPYIEVGCWRSKSFFAADPISSSILQFYVLLYLYFCLHLQKFYGKHLYIYIFVVNEVPYCRRYTRFLDVRMLINLNGALINFLIWSKSFYFVRQNIKK